MRALQLEVRCSVCALPRHVCLPSACIFVCLRVFVLTSYSNVLLDLAPSAPRSSRYLLNPREFRGLLGLFHPPSLGRHFADEPTGLVSLWGCGTIRSLFSFFQKGTVGARAAERGAIWRQPGPNITKSCIVIAWVLKLRPWVAPWDGFKDDNLKVFAQFIFCHGFTRGHRVPGAYHGCLRVRAGWQLGPVKCGAFP